MYMTFTADDTKEKINSFISSTKFGYHEGSKDIVDVEFELNTYERSCMYTYIRKFQMCKISDCWITIDCNSDSGSDVMIWDDKDKAIAFSNKIFADMKDYYDSLADNDDDFTRTFNYDFDMLSQPKTTSEEEQQFLKSLQEDNNAPVINFQSEVN